MISLLDQGASASCPAPFNMAAYVLACARQIPQKPALLLVGDTITQTWTYQDLRRAVLGTGTGLLDRGLTPGDRVLMRLDNTVDFPIAYLGALAVGLVPIPTSAALTQVETAAIIAQMQPAAILHDTNIACPVHPGRITLDELRSYRTRPPANWHMGDPDRLGYIIYTSGTAGTPRAVAHAHRAIRARRMMFKGWYGLTCADRVMHAGAFNWTYTLGTGLMDPWTVGATAVIPAPGTPTSALPALLTRHKITIFAATPGVYRQLQKGSNTIDSPALRHGLSAGETLGARVAAGWTAKSGTPVFEAYGLSECSTFISGAPDRPAAPGALGQPQTGRRVALVGANGPVARGQEGTIAVHRTDPGLMLGYLNAPDETAARMQGDWFLTGDQGVMSAAGHITYLGRKDDMMNAGGVRVSPIEVEAVLGAVPGITTVAVTDVKIKTDTRVIAAFYTGPTALDDHDLYAYVSDKLARYKQPRLYIHTPALPTGANGKILRRALRAGFEAPR